MINSIDQFLSQSAKGMKRSAIREILKLLQKPGMISFAGGLPAPETFPVNDLKEIALDVLEKEGAFAFSTVLLKEILSFDRCWLRDIKDRA